MPDVIAEPHPRSNGDLINRIRLVRGDLTAQGDVDAIVGSISVRLNAKGSLNQALMGAAGEDMDRFILEHIYNPRSGDVVALPPFKLNTRHVLYAITPEWRDGIEHEDRDLIRCYRSAMQLAHRMGLKRIAFPALGTGARKYPVKRAARLAIQGIMDRMTPDFEEVRIVCNKPETYAAFEEWLRFYGWRG